MARGLTAAQWVEATDPGSLADLLAERIAQQLQANVQEFGKASLVVSGGSTPLPVFQVLAQASIDWSRVQVTLADERWVSTDHPDSNETFVRENLLVERAAAATFVPLYRDDVGAADAIAELDSAISMMAQPFSVVVLGMGEDGHTASLFPNTAGLEAALDLDGTANVAVLQPSTVPQLRITLTRRALLNSRYRYLHITGEKKKQVLEQALHDGDGVAAPIASFFEKHVPPMSVYWSP